MFFNLIVFLIFTLKTASGLPRISNIICENSENETLIWKVPIKETKISSLCPLYVVLRGFFNPEAIQNRSEVVLDNFEYYLQPELSFKSNPKTNEMILGLPLEKVYIDKKKLEPESETKIYLGDVTLPAVTFCGELYLFVALYGVAYLSRLRMGIFSKRIHAFCHNESNISVVLNQSISSQSYIPISIPKPHSQRYKLTIPSSYQFQIVNKGNVSFQARCGIYSLQVIAFLVPAKRNKSLDYMQIGNKFVFNVFQFISHSSKNVLLTYSDTICSPEISANAKVDLKVDSFEIDQKELQENYEVGFIIDPLNLEDFSTSIQNRTFLFKVNILCENCEISLKKCNVFSNISHTIISYSNENRVEYFIYDIEQNLLTRMFDESKAIIESNKNFYTYWLTQISSDILIKKHEFSSKDIPDILLNSVDELLLDIFSIIASTNISTSNEAQQKAKLLLLLDIVRLTYIKLLYGNLNIYFPQLLKFYSNLKNDSHFKSNNYRDYSWFTLEKVVADIVEREPPLESLSKAIPKRIRQFIRRVYFNPTEVLFVYNFERIEEKKYVHSLQTILQLIVEKKFWNIKLPLNFNEKMKDIVSAENEQDIVQTIRDLLSMLKNEERKNIDLVFFSKIFLKAVNSNFWFKWIELKHRFMRLLKENKYLYIYGIPRQITLRTMAHKVAFYFLLKRKIFPDNLLPEKQNEYLDNNWKFVYYNVNNGFVERAASDVITGKIISNKIMMCQSLYDLKKFCLSDF